MAGAGIGKAVPEIEPRRVPGLAVTIKRVERDPSDKPVTPVVLKKVTIVPEGELIPIPKAPPSGPETEIRHSGPPPIALPQPSMPPPQP